MPVRAFVEPVFNERPPYLTPTMVSREQLNWLHSKLDFISTINQKYDEMYAAAAQSMGNQDD